jgi:hypothetical protein
LGSGLKFNLPLNFHFEHGLFDAEIRPPSHGIPAEFQRRSIEGHIMVVSSPPSTLAQSDITNLKRTHQRLGLSNNGGFCVILPSRIHDKFIFNP